MKKINLSNSKKRDAIVGFEAKPTRRKVFQVLKDGTEKRGVRVLKSTLKSDIEALKRNYEDLDQLSEAIIKDDVDVDLEYAGMLLED